MSLAHTSPAIILRIWDYSESDAIVSFLTPDHGRIQGIAKGFRTSRKRFGGSIDLFHLSSITYKESKNHQLAFMNEAQLIYSFPKIQADYSKMMLTMGLLELTYRLYPEGEKDARPFNLLKEHLYALESAENPQNIFWSAVLDHLKNLGVAPKLDQCVSCERVNVFEGYDPQRGGVVCKNCVSMERMHFSKTRIVDLELDQVLMSHVEYHLELSLDWQRFVV